jgi:ribosome-interacting GTPase 1
MPCHAIVKSGSTHGELTCSVGKSTLLSTVTPTQSAMASYEFTTLTCIPGNDDIVHHPFVVTTMAIV